MASALHPTMLPSIASFTALPMHGIPRSFAKYIANGWRSDDHSGRGKGRSIGRFRFSRLLPRRLSVPTCVVNFEQILGQLSSLVIILVCRHFRTQPHSYTAMTVFEAACDRIVGTSEAMGRLVTKEMAVRKLDGSVG